MTIGDKPGKPPAPDPEAGFRFDSGTLRVEGLVPPTEGHGGSSDTPAPAAGVPEDLDSAIASRLEKIRLRQERVASRVANWDGRSGAAWLPLSTGKQALLAAAAAIATVLTVLLAYLAGVVPGPWFPGEVARSFAAPSLEVTRGTGVANDGEVVVSAPGEGQLTIVSVNTQFRAERLRAIAWIATAVPESATVRVAWRSDTDPSRTFSMPAAVEAGRLRPVVVADAPGWIGNIRGLGLIIQGPLPQPVRIRGVIATPMGAIDVLAARWSEWSAFEAWSGTSVNVVVGGADVQDLPLPILIAIIVALTGAVFLLIWHWRPRLLPRVGMMLAVVFLAGWFVLDLRWTVNLARQIALTQRAYGGKDDREKHLAAADGALYEFILRARAVLPPAPQRIWVVSDAPFFSGRGAYHLYPHNVHFEPRGRAMPDPAWIRPGDWLLVFNRRGVEFDAQRQRIRWDGKPEIAAELKASGTGAALFLLR